jgi:acetyl-CoA carboxylase carboxyl transferase subunit alpha
MLEEMEKQIQELEQLSQDPAAQEKLRELQRMVEEIKAMPGEPSAWQRVQLARHPQRPYFLDYVQLLFQDFSEISGDRAFADDAAVICGMAGFRGREVMLVGQQKGRSTKEKLARNWGMSKPEGYRKALRVMRLAAKFRRPIFTFLDTPGAYPGMDAEARGQAEAIAHNLREMSRLESPIIVTVIGEGGSGGALGMGVGDHILIQENAIYSVISPESCAAIVWRDSGKAELAANALRLTADDLLRLGLVDEIVPEPPGGAQNDHRAAADLLGTALERALSSIEKMSAEELRRHRYQKFRQMAAFWEA